MRARFEFAFHTIPEPAAVGGDVDPTLALMGAQGWEIRGVACLRDGVLTVALQRPLGEDLPLPDEGTLSAALAAPMTAPTPQDLEREPRYAEGENVA
jgi:hypothetical protein